MLSHGPHTAPDILVLGIMLRAGQPLPEKTKRLRPPAPEGDPLKGQFMCLPSTPNLSCTIVAVLELFQLLQHFE